MRLKSLISLLTPAVLLVSSFAQVRTSNAITVPVEFRQDFEEGHISGWESYPPFQDSAFDPDFKCSGENNLPGSRHALTRKVQLGFRSPYEIGFIRKARLRLTSSSVVSFSYLLTMYGDAKRMDAVLCGANGKKYTYTIPSPKNDQWQTVTIGIASFRNGRESLSLRDDIDAFYLVAIIGSTNPDVAYRFYLDNVKMTGAMPAQFRIVTPGSSFLEHWDKTVLHHHYAMGETLGLAASLPSGIALGSVKFSLHNPDGIKIVDDAPLSLRGATGNWEHSQLHRFLEHDPRGRWRGRLWGEDGHGQHIETLFDVWVTDRPQPHPRLYFGPDSLPAFARRAEEPRWKTWFDSLAAKAMRLRSTSNLGSISPGPGTSPLVSLQHVDLDVYDTTFLLPTLSHYYGVMFPAMEILYSHALLYAFKGDTAAGEFAKNALVAIAGWKSWTHPWFRARHQESYYPVGELGVRAAFCYDVTSPLLKEEERRAVREGLLRNCVIPVYKEYVVEDRIPSSTSNWIGNSISGALSCLLAIYGDDSTHREVEPYFSGLLIKLEEHIRSTLDTSGAWGEGIGYQSFAYTNVLPTLTALARVFRADIAPPALLRSYLYFLYNTSSSEVLDVGDSHPVLSTGSCFAWILSRTDDQSFRWLYNMGPREHALDFLFGGSDRQAAPPGTLPGSKLFTDIGSVVFRSGWTADDLVLNFRCGPFFNHQHFDQGSFQLRAFGETLVPEAGTVHYYNDPWYQSYYIQAVGHNTVLVDGNPGSQRSGDYLHFVKAADVGARMRQFIGTEEYAAATGEMHEVYRDSLDLFERNIVFMRPDYFVLFDRLRSSGKNHEFDWLLHYDERRDVTVSGSDIRITRGQASLLAKVLSPENAAVEVKGAPTRLGIPLTYPGYVKVSNSRKSNREDFLVVLYPTKAQQSSESEIRTGSHTLSDHITSFHGRNSVGARISRGNAKDVILFRTDEDQREMTDGHVRTDGRLVARTSHEKTLQRIAVHDATYLVCTDPDGRSPFDTLRATMKFTAAGSLQDDTADWEIQSPEAGSLMMHSTRRPVELKRDGQPIPSFSWDKARSLLVVAVAKGNSQFTIHYEHVAGTGARE